MKTIDYEINLELYQIYEIVGLYFADFDCYSDFDEEFNCIIRRCFQESEDNYNGDIYKYDDIEIIYYDDGSIDEVQIDFKLLLLNQYLFTRIKGISSIPKEIRKKIYNLTKEIDDYYHNHNNREIINIKYVKRLYFDD